MSKFLNLPLKDAYSASIGNGNQGLLFTADNEGVFPEQSHVYAPLYSPQNTFIGTLELQRSSGSSPVHYFVCALHGPNDTLPHDYPHVRFSLADHTIFVINAKTSEGSNGIPAPDSTSEESKKTVAPFDLSGESLATLYQLAENAQNLELLKAAALELDKRRGCDV